MKVLSWALPMATALAYGVWRYFAGQVYVGDLPPFDLHLYSFAQAQTYLTGLSPDAKAIYLGPLHRADTALLLLLAATLILPVWRLGWLWCLPALAYAGLDLLENAAVSERLIQGIREAGDVDIVTLLTLSKFVALGIAGLLAIWSLWRKQRKRG